MFFHAPETRMAQNKRRRQQICAEPDSYLAELNHLNLIADVGCLSPPPSTDSSVLTKRESGIAAEQCGDAYLDLLNKLREDGGACDSPSDSSASGEPCPSQVPLGHLALADLCPERQLSQRRAVAGQSAPHRQCRAPRRKLTLQEKVGSGAFGSVFKCTWHGRDLAVKMHRDVAPGVSPAERELKLLKQLAIKGRSALISHLEAWRKTDSGVYQLFFERFHCDLRTLLQRSSDSGALVGARQAMRFALNLSAAVAFAHSRRVIHRDLKPANILLRRMDELCAESDRQPAATAEQWEAAIADFGNSAIVRHDLALQGGACSVARWAETGRALSRNVCTLWYAAPEMLVSGEGYGYPADIWSLGLVLLEIEAREAACPTRLGAADWEQLREFWRLCQPAAATSGFLLRARQELMRSKVFHTAALHSGTVSEIRVASGGVGHRSRVGQFYGARFRAFAFRLLDFESQKRVTAQALSASCKQGFQQYAPLPFVWSLQC